MASVHTLAFAPAPDQGARVHYSLLELPAEILSSLETADLTIKGQPDDEAVLCTANQTYAIRASVNSNSLLLCRARDADADDAAAQGATLDIMTTLRQTLEVLPTRPRTERIEDLLRDSIWESEEADAAERPSKRRRRYTTDDLHDLVQASDGQIDDALTTSHVLTLGPDGHRRPVAPKVLPKLLTAMLESLSVNDLDPKLLNLADLIAAMPQEHDMSTEVAENVVNWFASGPPGAATLDIAAVVAELGRSLLVNWRPAAGTARSKAKEIPHEAFMEQWRAAVGEGNVGLCDLKLLAGDHLFVAAPTPHLISAPSRSLPLEPVARFAALFALRPKWTSAEILPYLQAIGANDKERERWLLKCARKIKTGATTSYVSRTSAPAT